MPSFAPVDPRAAPGFFTGAIAGDSAAIGLETARSARRCRHLVKPGGVFVETDLGFLGQNLFLILLTWRIGSRRVLLPIPRYTKQNVLLMRELLEARRYRAVIDRRFPLDEVIAATRYVESGQKIGNVVLTVRREA